MYLSSYLSIYFIPHFLFYNYIVLWLYKVPARPRCYVSKYLLFFVCSKFPISTDILSLTAHVLISSFLCLIPKQPTLKTMSILLFSPFRCQRFLWSTKIATDHLRLAFAVCCTTWEPFAIVFWRRETPGSCLLRFM